MVVRAETPEGGYKMLAPVECAIAGYSDGATANPGEGWLSTDGVNFGDVLALAASEGVTNASICLKAFGERVYTASDAPAPVTGDVTVSDGAAEAFRGGNFRREKRRGAKRRDFRARNGIR